MGEGTKPRKPLDHSLERLEEALARNRASEATQASASSAPLVPVRSSVNLAHQVSIPLASVLLVVLLWMGMTTGYFFLIPASFTGLWLASLLARRRATPVAALTTRSAPRIGMGATVASDAVLREGSVVEMGATVGAAAVLERKSVVRMGASVGPRAVLEEGALVSWGASVGEDAVVGAGAVVAAGADVAAGARVPARTYLAPGTSWTAAQGSGSSRILAAHTGDKTAPESDLRVEQIGKACDRLEEEYARAPELVRTMFGDPHVTLSSLRRTCLDLVMRERALRAEASPEALARLEQEKVAIEERIATVSDEQVRQSLLGAVTAIAAQQEQRKQLQNQADRLDAELTRLVWIVDGMGTELVRARTAGTELYQGSTTEIARSVEQLKDEINNVAQALEEVNAAGVSNSVKP